jgi:ketosteroid isomerase-like protein
MARDVAAVAKYTADDFIAVNPAGSLTNKQQRLDGFKTPAAPGAKPPEPQRTEAVHMFGAGSAVARLKAIDSRLLAVWIRGANGWQVHAIHVVPDTFMPQTAAPESLKAAGPSPVTSPAGLSGDRAAVFAAFKQLQDAVWSGDPATYAKLTAPDFVRLLPGMMRFGTEAQAAGQGPRKPPVHSDITVNVWDQLGVVRWREKNAAGVETWLTRVFAKKGVAWQQVATASSLAAKAGS